MVWNTGNFRICKTQRNDNIWALRCILQMLASIDLRILSELRTGGASVTEIATAIGYDKSHVSRRISYLESLELLTRENGSGRKQQVSRQTNEVTTSYDKVLDELSVADIPDLLGPSTLEVIWAIRKPHPVKRITPHVPLSRVRVHQILKSLRRRQLVENQDGEYCLKPEYNSLSSFATALTRHFQDVSVRRVLPDSTVVWAAPYEALVIPGEETPESLLDEILSGGPMSTEPVHPGSGVEEATWSLTGLIAFREYGLPFLHAGQPLLYKSAPELDVTLDVEHFIVHTLRRRIDDRRTSYCTMLIVRSMAKGQLDVSYLQTLGAEYGVSKVLSHLLRFVAVRGAYEPPEEMRGQLPTWSQIEGTAEQYDVDVIGGSLELAKAMGVPPASRGDEGDGRE